MGKYGLIGKRLAHSFSKDYFERKFRDEGLTNCSYELIELPGLEGLRNIVAARGLAGFNVTIPYKERILPLLDSIDSVALEVGAVNTVSVLRNEDGNLHLRGYNTDAPAFLETLRPMLQGRHRNALILGTGGAAKAVAWALDQLGIAYRFVSRTPESHRSAIGYSEIPSYCTEPLVIVNATPVGMFPDTCSSPWPFPELLTRDFLCYDLVYNPSPTLFLQQAAAHGATVVDGLRMLHLQAEKAWEMWRTQLNF